VWKAAAEASFRRAASILEAAAKQKSEGAEIDAAICR
jgi:hypothetical protein